jgi:hypothetical protein
VVSDQDDEHDDPFDGVTLDDAFVDGARVREGTAEERLARMERIDTEHRRLLADARDRAARADAIPAASVAPHRARRRPWAILVLVTLVATFLVVRAQGDGDPSDGNGDRATEASLDQAAALDRQPVVGSVELAGGQPPPGVDAQPGPLGTPAPLPAGSGPHAFAMVQANGGAPVAYDPCRPIHVVVNGRTAPSSGDDLLDEALARTAEATGLQFVVDGSSTEVPVENRQPYQPERYPGRWAPVLIAWSDPAETKDLADGIAGLGGSVALSLADGSSLYVSGRVVLDGPQLTELLRAPNGEVYARAVIQHELGHLVGLDHVTDPSQLMYAEGSTDVTDFGVGDLQGLAELGRGRCFPNV